MIVASIQTVATRGLDEFDLIIIDEAHRAASRRDYRALMARFAGKIVIGLSATPFAKGLGAHDPKIGGNLFEGIIIGSTISDLIKTGVLVDCEIYAPSEPDVSKVKVVAGEYQQDQLAEVSDKPELIGDIVNHWLKHANGEQTICFATRIEHSKHIVEQFIKAEVPALHVDSYMDPEEQDEIYRLFENGDAVILSNVGMLEEGFDVPSTSVMIDAKPTKSLTAWIQRCGRVLRAAPGKSGALILDHAGNAKRLGFPTDDLPLELDDGSREFAERRETRQDKRIEPKKCPSCFKVRQPGVKACPCGYMPMSASCGMEVGEGELQRMDRNAPKSSKKSKASKASMADKQTWFSMLTHIARERGYKPGWAANQYRQKFDVWPKGLSDVPIPPTAEVASWVRSRQIAYAKRRKLS
jgi:superfamily II DNA or RNA helicase